MYTFLVILAVITAILLAIVVLIQESKGGGLASNVSGANSVLVVWRTPSTEFCGESHMDFGCAPGCVQRGNELLCEVCGSRRCYRH